MDRDDRQLISPASMTGLLSVIAGAGLLFGRAPFWWFGAGFVLAGLVTLACAFWPHIERARDRLSKPRKVWRFEVVPLTLIFELLCVGTILVVASVMLPEAALGDRPVGKDHPVHYFKAWQFWEHFLTDGQLRGWSHRWFAGYPVNFHYPMGGDLWVSLVYALGLGFLDFSQAYGVAFWLFWALSGWAVYFFAKQGFGRWAAVIAAVLFMGNSASYRTGGWVFAAEWGVWPQSFAVVLGVLAVAFIPRIVEGKSWRHVGVFAMLLGASLITHPMMVVFFAAVGPVALLALWISRTGRPWLPSAARLVTGYVLGILLGGLWLFPYIANSAFSHSGIGRVWATAYEMGRDLYALELLPGTWGLVVALGAVGCIGLLWGRKFHHVLTGLLATVFILGGATSFANAFHLYELLEPLGYVHLQRFPILLKPFWFAAAGYALVLVLTAAARGWQMVREPAGEPADADGSDAPRRWAARYAQAFAFALILTPLMVPLVNEYGSKHIKRSLPMASERPHQSERRQFVDWLERTHPGGQPFFRIATDVSEHDHSLVDLGAEIDFPLYKFGFTPAGSYVNKVDGDQRALLEALNVRYVISLRPIKRAHLEEVERFGQLRVYEFARWQPDPFEVIDGEGPVELVRFEDEEIVLEAAEGASGTLRLNVSHAPSWRATRDGEPVEIDTVAIGDPDKSAFMTVELAPGTYRFSFETQGVEWLSWLLFLLAATLVVLLLWSGRPDKLGRKVAARLDRLIERLERLASERRRLLAVVGCVAVAIAFAVAVALALWKPPLEADEPGFSAPIEQVRYDFATRLPSAQVGVRQGGSYDACHRVMDHFVCGGAPWTDVFVRTVSFDDKAATRCIWAHPRDDGPVEIHFRDVPAADALVGVYGVTPGPGRRGAPVSLTVGVDGREVHSAQTEADGRTHLLEAPLDDVSGGPVDVTFTVDAKDTGRRHFCFNAQMVDMGQ
jgi:hypothetical protein